jgi:hypothetical protein
MNLVNIQYNFTEIKLLKVICRTNLATAHARLNLRSIVSERDAVMAVYLYEQWMAQAYGVLINNRKLMAGNFVNLHLTVSLQTTFSFQLIYRTV